MFIMPNVLIVITNSSIDKMTVTMCCMLMHRIFMFRNLINVINDFFRKLFFCMFISIQWLSFLCHRFSLLVVVIVTGVEHRFHNSIGDRKMSKYIAIFQKHWFLHFHIFLVLWFRAKHLLTTTTTTTITTTAITITQSKQQQHHNANKQQSQQAQQPPKKHKHKSQKAIIAAHNSNNKQQQQQSIFFAWTLRTTNFCCEKKKQSRRLPLVANWTAVHIALYSYAESIIPQSLDLRLLI